LFHCLAVCLDDTPRRLALVRVPQWTVDQMPFIPQMCDLRFHVCLEGRRYVAHRANQEDSHFSLNSMDAPQISVVQS
jgi:hypothetical protein